MRYQDILSKALSITEERGKQYGPMYPMATRAAALAAIRLNKTITAYDIVVILSCVKQSRLSFDPNNTDSWIDSIAYDSFAAQLAMAKDGGALSSDMRDVVLAQVEHDLRETLYGSPVQDVPTVEEKAKK
jgi:hypothetical protein